MINRVVLPYLLTVVSASALAGPLAPPGGPVGETGRFGPRIEVNDVNTPGDINSLFKIVTPGSYYLASNVMGVVGKHGIVIASSGVALDLMGFELNGVVNSVDGINVSVSSTNLRIHNGAVRSWGGDGVDAIKASNSAISDLLVRGNGGQGIVAGKGWLIEDCAVESNGFGSAINVQDNSTISRCTAQNNTGNGIRAAKFSSITQCVSNGNSVIGIFTGDGCTVSQCTVTANDIDGLRVGNYCVVTACAASLNGADGISSNGGCVILGSSAGQNGNDGFLLGSYSTITQCSAYNNTGDGIQIAGASHAIDNNCHFNGVGVGAGAGIHPTSADNRIEGNNVSFNDRGIDVDFAGNLIVRNSASGNSFNYDIVAGNNVGVIVVAPISGTINGSSGGAGVGTTNPWANFSY